MVKKLCIYVANLQLYNNGCLIGTWVELPISVERFKEVLEQIGIINGDEPFFIADFETTVTHLEIGEYEDLENLNILARQLNAMTEAELRKLNSVQIYLGPSTVSEVLQTVNDLGRFDVLSDVMTVEDLGHYYAEMCNTFAGIPVYLQSYIDFAKYGLDIFWSLSSCGFSSYGLVIDNR